MICMLFIFADYFWEALRGKTFLKNREQMAICAGTEFAIEMLITATIIG